MVEHHQAVHGKDLGEIDDPQDEVQSAIVGFGMGVPAQFSVFHHQGNPCTEETDDDIPVLAEKGERPQ